MSNFLFILKTINLFIDIIGFLFYGNIVILTIKHKKLHTICHILLGLYSICQSFSKIIMLIPYILQYILPNFEKNLKFIYFCIIFNIIPFSFMMGAFTYMLAIGIDRMLGIYFPLWYKQKKSKLYWSFLTIMPLIYPTYNTYIVIQSLVGGNNSLVF
ncbi:unnamed protein product [Meloidogyne enterolobii]|uniref:Uncharacterized protein n=1 Tax=Meloidogyne enterolobii TaxID=390850 RepID=A0ACB0ZYB7_MELEN